MAGLWFGVVALPAFRPVFWTLAGLVSAGAIALGITLHRPRRPWPWGLIAAGLLFATTGDTIVDLTEAGPAWLRLIADGLYLAMFTTTAAALWILSRSASALVNRAGRLDAVTVATAVALLTWVGVLGPRIGAVPAAQAAPLVAYLLGDVLLLAGTVRLVSTRRPTPAVVLLALGMVALVSSDVLATLEQTAAWQLGALVDLCYVLQYAAWGAAGLHASMARLTEPEVLPAWDVTSRRLYVLALTSLIGPAVLVAQFATGSPIDAVLIAVATAVIFMLNLVRVSDAVTANRHSLAHRETHDTLTGLANRGLFAERLTAIMATGPESRPNAGVLLIDLDGFKLLNDTMGHAVGDEVLVAVARRLARQLGRHDLAARFGGDEFAVLIVPDPPPDGATEVETADLDGAVARIAAALARPVTFSTRSVRVTASIGVATVADVTTGGPVTPDRCAQDLLGHAGLALQAAQAAGRGQSCRYESDLHGLMVERMRLRSALDRAVTDGSFALQYQPIVALDTGETVGFEALVRWEHPTRGVIGPSAFIQVAEETGLIDAIGDWVLHRAVTVAAGWHRTMPPGVYVSVNVSAHQLRQGRDGSAAGFAEKVDRELAAAGLPPENLMLELTESVLLGEEDQVWAELTTLRDTGVRLAIDDFGTGFSSMRYLLHTPIDVIKIDKSFVGSVATSPRRQAVVDGIVRLGEALGLRVVAEGIETAADRDVLAGMGCPYGQGFLYSAPIGPAEAHRWLAGRDDEYAHSGGTPTPPGTLPT
jgi:diguanylate cyclase (GGDEF)-like protein